MAEDKKSGSCATCMKVLIIVTSVVFGIFGGLVAAGGILLLMGNSVWDNYLSDAIKFIPKMPALANITGYESLTDDEISNLSLDLNLISKDLGIALTVVGGFMFLMGIFGCSIFCCKDIISLVLYLIFLGVVIIVQIALLIVFFGGFFNGRLKNILNDTLVEEYKGIDELQGTSLAWNYFMVEFECCGLENYKDFDYAAQWNRNRTFVVNDTDTYLNMATPLACCKLIGDFPDANITDVDNCFTSPNSTNSNFELGCWEAVGNEMDSYRTIFMAVFIVLVVIQAALWVAVIVLFCGNERQKKKDSVKPMTPGGGD